MLHSIIVWMYFIKWWEFDRHCETPKSSRCLAASLSSFPSSSLWLKFFMRFEGIWTLHSENVKVVLMCCYCKSSTYTLYSWLVIFLLSAVYNYSYLNFWLPVKTLNFSFGSHASFWSPCLRGHPLKMWGLAQEDNSSDLSGDWDCFLDMLPLQNQASKVAFIQKGIWDCCCLHS